MGYHHLAVSTADHIGRITLQRADGVNSLSHETLLEVDKALAELSGDGSTRVIIIGGAGRAFSVGHDLNEMIERDAEFYGELFAACTTMMERIRTVPQPVIAKVQGVAAAAGCQLVAACDLVVAAASSRFGTTGLKVGLFCSTPMVPLSRAIGRKRALEMLLTGDLIDAATAADWGLVNRVVPDEQLEAETLALATKIAGHAAGVVALGKRAFYRQIEMPMDQAYRFTGGVIAANAAAPDGQEGMGAFLDKRQPEWTHEPLVAPEADE